MAGVAFGGLVLLTSLNIIRPWGGRFYSLWDTDYARKYIPIIASVSEHQPTAWTSWFFDLHFLVRFTQTHRANARREDGVGVVVVVGGVGGGVV